MAKTQPTINVYNTRPTATPAPQVGTSTEKDFISYLIGELSELNTEITERNDNIEEKDAFIYGDSLQTSLDIPVGHDFTPVNWLRRSVEIHKIQFMGRPFQVISTYDTKKVTDDNDEIENEKEKEYAELRKDVIDSIIRDNGGHALFMDGAESASATGNWVIKAWYDEDEQKYVLSTVEAVENCYAIWSGDDYRQFDVFAYAYQITKRKAIEKYGVAETVPTSALGKPFNYLVNGVQAPTSSSQQMVTIIEATGKICGYSPDGKSVKKVKEGDEKPMNVLICGNEIVRVVADDKKLPRHYIFPNKKQRRRPWGVSDISDAAISINLTYIETLSDWRTVSSKVNFPKFKGFQFGSDTQMPKYKARSVQILPLAEGQDIQLLQQGDANQIDFTKQLDEMKEQFVRETGISRVLFDDPSITLNSNQALLTSMKPTSDIAEAKKQLWEPILREMFTEAIEILAKWRNDVKDLADGNWSLKVQWPSVMQKEDPVFQSTLLNRFNAGTMSLQSFLEAQGETKEEIDRIRDEFTDPVTASVLGKQTPALAQHILMAAGAQLPITGRGGQAPNGQPAQVASPAENVPGVGPVSQPGTGATSASPAGAVAVQAQNAGV